MLHKIKHTSQVFYASLVGGLYLLLDPGLALADVDGVVSITVDNPLGDSIDTLPELVTLILNVVVQIGVPIVALGIIYSGFLFVKAQGKPEDIKTAREAFFWTVIGSLIVLGAFVISTIIQGTIDQLK